MGNKPKLEQYKLFYEKVPAQTPQAIELPKKKPGRKPKWVEIPAENVLDNVAQ